MNNNQESNQIYICPICGNTDIHSIGYLNGKPYCRRCISFKGEEVKHKPSYPKKAPIHLSYELSLEQKELSDKLVENYKKGIDSLVYAVTGSGKTEITLQVLQYAINCGERVAFAVPRRDVVIELHSRLSNIFKENKVISVYGGHHQDVDGDLVVLTTHQFFRYQNYFSLIILDEIDAFPFKGDEVLRKMFFNSLIGNYIMMSATPTKEAIELFKGKNKEILRLDIRFHHHAIPVPRFYINRSFFRYFILIKEVGKILKHKKQLFIFVPTIEEADIVFILLSIFYRKGHSLHSQKNERNKIISDFRRGIYRFLVTTSVLERGVTVKDLQVIVFNAHHVIYDKGTLIQISGRAGRKADAPRGEVIFIAKRKTNEMVEARSSIINSNKALQDLLSRDQ